MFVLTVDQQDSTRLGDKVPDLLVAAQGWGSGLPGVVLPFERTVGDEVQALVASGGAALRFVLEIVRFGGWRVGLGIGGVDRPVPRHSREASGSAFVHARAAIDRAKGRSTAVPVTIRGDRAEAAADAEALVRLLGAIVERRTPQGWEVVDLLRGDASGGMTQRAVARTLGISEQAVSQRIRAAMWAEERAAWPLAIRLLDGADHQASP